MKRVIKAIAKNGEVDLEISIKANCSGLYKNTSERKIEELKDGLYRFLNEKYRYSQIKIV